MLIATSPCTLCGKSNKSIQSKNSGILSAAIFFGGKGSRSLFIAFNALVTWIGKNEYKIINLAAYSNDSFGVDLAKNLSYYEPYHRYFPTNQAKLLQLWDYLGIPHKEKKQTLGTNLTIIGIKVDAKNLTLTLPPNSKSDLISQLNELLGLRKVKGSNMH